MPISRLRKKLGDHGITIKVARGLGYLMDDAYRSIHLTTGPPNGDNPNPFGANVSRRRLLAYYVGK